MIDKCLDSMLLYLAYLRRLYFCEETELLQ